MNIFADPVSMPQEEFDAAEEIFREVGGLKDGLGY